MMGSINIFSLLFILKLLRTDASINIYQSGVQAGSGHFECGEEFVLTCQIDSYSVSMALQNDSSNVPLAECFLNTCTLNPDVANRYTLSTNTATGTFNLTFNVSNYHNGTTFMCDDASNSKSSLFLMNDYEPTIIETNQTQLEVMSGCINSGVTVTFLWKKVEAKTMNESDYKFDNSNKHEYSNATICELDEECGGQGLIKRIMSIDVEEEGTDEYYLKAILSYPGVKKEILTSKTYKIKQVSGPNRCVWDITDYALATSIGSTFGIHLVAVAVLYLHTVCDKDLFLRSTYVKTGLISIPINSCLILCIANWIRCSSTNPCPSCEYMGILRYIWMTVVIINWGYGCYRLIQIRKRCNNIDENEKKGVIYFGQDTVFIINLFNFIILTCFLLLIVWIAYKIVEGKKQTQSDRNKTETKIQKKSTFPALIENVIQPSQRDQTQITDHIEKIAKSGAGGTSGNSAKKDGFNNENRVKGETTKTSNKNNLEKEVGQKSTDNSGAAHPLDKKIAKSGSEKKDNVREKIQKHLNEGKADGQNSDENQGSAADTSVTITKKVIFENKNSVKGEIGKPSKKNNFENLVGQSVAENRSTAGIRANNANKGMSENTEVIKGGSRNLSNEDNLEKGVGRSDTKSSETAHPLDNKRGNKSGSETNSNVKEEVQNHSIEQNGHGQNSDENHVTKIFVNRPAQSNIVVQPVDGIQQNSADKQDGYAHNYIRRGISTVFTNPDNKDAQPD